MAACCNASNRAAWSVLLRSLTVTPLGPTFGRNSSSKMALSCDCNRANSCKMLSLASSVQNTCRSSASDLSNGLLTSAPGTSNSKFTKETSIAKCLVRVVIKGSAMPSSCSFMHFSFMKMIAFRDSRAEMDKRRGVLPSGASAECTSPGLPPKQIGIFQTWTCEAVDEPFAKWKVLNCCKGSYLTDSGSCFEKANLQFTLCMQAVHAVSINAKVASSPEASPKLQDSSISNEDTMWAVTGSSTTNEFKLVHSKVITSLLASSSKILGMARSHGSGLQHLAMQLWQWASKMAVTPSSKVRVNLHALGEKLVHPKNLPLGTMGHSCDQSLEWLVLVSHWPQDLDALHSMLDWNKLAWLALVPEASHPPDPLFSTTCPS